MLWATLSDLEAAIRKAMTVRDPARLRELQPHIRSFDESHAQALEIYIAGVIEEFTGAFDQALALYEEALAAFNDVHEAFWTANVHINIGSVHYFRSDFANAMAEFERALDLRSADGAQISPILNNIGAVYYNVADYPRALEYFERALRDCRSRDEHNGAAAALMNMGNVYSSMQEREKALAMYMEARAIHEEHGAERDTFMVNCNITHSLATQELTDEAEEVLDRAERIARSEENALMLERVHSLRLALLRQRRLFDEAETFIEDHNFLETPTIPFRVNALRDMALVRRERGDFQKAISYMEQALSVAEQHQLRSFAEGFHEELMEIAKQAGAFELYIKHNERFLQLKDELRGKEASVKIAMYNKERELEAERQEARKHRALLHSTLPAAIAERMLRGEDVSGDVHEHAAVLFLDIVGFTTHSSRMLPQETTALLAQIFEQFDEICKHHQVTKIKTIGDSYMAVAFGSLASARDDNQPSALLGDDMVIPSASEERIARVALAMLQAEFFWPTATADSNSNRVQFRIGIHSGPLTAGVIGTQRLQYDVWGDTVNVASRMESTGEPGRIQVSSDFYEQLSSRAASLARARDDNSTTASGNSDLVIPSASEEPRPPISDIRSPKLTERGEVSVKGIGTMTTYWLEGA